MVKEFGAKGAFDKYNEFLQERGEKESITPVVRHGFYSDKVVEMAIRDRVLAIKDEVHRVNHHRESCLVDSTRYIIGNMVDLAQCINERYHNGKHMELSKDMIDLLLSDFDKALCEDDNRYISIELIEVDDTTVVNGLGQEVPCVKGITLSVRGERVLGIRTFEDDRFNNEAMISCNQSRYHGFSKGCRVISRNYIFGEDGTFVNASNKSFLDTVGDPHKEDFPFCPELEYYYMPYFPYIKPIDIDGKYVYINRHEGLRVVVSDKGEKTYRFKPMLLDCTFVGGPLKNNEEVIEQAYKCYEVKDDEPKQLIKK